MSPRRLNTAVATLFMIGSLGFALGSTSFYSSAVGPTPDAVTFFVASIFFTSASLLQLLQSQSPAMAPAGTSRDDERGRVRLLAWLPRDKGWLAAATQFPGTLFFNGTTFWAMTIAVTNSQYDEVVWRPDFYGSVLFLVSSLFAILAVGPAALVAAARGRLVGRVAQHARVDRLHGVGDRRLCDPQDVLDDRPHAGRPWDLRRRRVLLPRRPPRHPGVPAGRRGCQRRDG